MSNGVQFRQHNVTLTPRNMLEIMKEDNAAFREMTLAKSRHDLALLFGFPGGFLIGWPIGTFIAGGIPNWKLAGVGAILTLVSVKCSLSYNRHARTAVGYYNEGLSPVEGTKTRFNLGLCNHGLGLTVWF
ncbi:MAG: hypothetical protein WCR72_13035 [Bacteroidota bacterium]